MAIYDPFAALEKPADKRRDEFAAILLAIEELRDAIERVTIPVDSAVDLDPVVAAIKALPAALDHPEPQPVIDPPTAHDIAQAIKEVNAFQIEMRNDDELTKTLKDLGDSIEKLRQRNGMGSAPYFSGGGVTNLSKEATRQLDDIRRGVSDFENRIDYADRTDSNPVYVGKATQGSALDATTWVIQKLTYDGSDRVTRAQVLTGAWADRTTLGWS